MKILFICYEYYGKRDAGSQCIHNLRGELYQHDVQSDVLTYDWTGDAPQEIADETGIIYTAKTWYRHARLTRNAAGQLKMSVVQWAKVIISRGFAIITEGKSYAQRGMPVGATKVLQKRLAELCFANGYDWVISVSYPFANHLAVLNAPLVDCKIALYNLDPYWNNQTYDPRKKIARALEEANAYKKADHIFCTPEQFRDYQNEYFAPVIERITPLNYTNFTRPCIMQKSCIRFDLDEINLLYLGTIYGDIRKPDTLFQLFEKALDFEPRLHLYVIGKKFGKNADQYLVKYQKKLGGHLTNHDPVPPEETADLLQQADILVNLGNTMLNQMPSKILEYLASGKPILNISARTDCNTLPLISLYPLVFQCFAQEPLDETRVAEFLRFCNEAKKNVIGWEELKDLYNDQLLSNVSRCLLTILRQ